MTSNLMQNRGKVWQAAHIIGSWVTAGLTTTLILLYAGALFGWCAPPADEKWAVRVEPVVLLAIGYYLGQLPMRRAEQVFGNALSRQAQKIDAAQHAKEQADQAREMLEERIRNAKRVLADGISVPLRGRGPAPGGVCEHAPDAEPALRQAVTTVLKILDL